MKKSTLRILQKTRLSLLFPTSQSYQPHSPFWPTTIIQGKSLPMEEAGVDPVAGLQVLIDDICKLNKPR